ncbi:MAG: hypothetical protein GF388_05935 [Candidatus Aegiribacteria sp.]|nr:hypothetical protein [Candidatus Aegiribacteria sp.]MBD3294721.1 hypothetical protein [Candidatus Fermentibacteria bacterium]
MSNLIDAASAGDYEALEDKWLEMLEEPPPYEEMQKALLVLIDREKEDLALQLLELTIVERDACDDRGYHDFLMDMAEIFGRSETLRRALIEVVRDRHLMFRPLENFLKLSGLKKKDAPVNSAWKRFRNLMQYREGGYVYHSTFGPGRISRVSRTHATIEFLNAHAHEMTLDVLLETTTALSEGSLVVKSWKSPSEFASLLKNEPEEFLEKAMTEPFVKNGWLQKKHMQPLAAASEISENELWKALKKSAASVSGFADLGSRIVPVDENTGITEQVRRIITSRKGSVSEKVDSIRSLLKSRHGSRGCELEVLLKELKQISGPETGALFELGWLLTEKGRCEGFARVSSEYLEKDSARAERALGEMGSLACRKAYLKAFFTGDTEFRERRHLLYVLRRSLWEYAMNIIEVSNPQLFSQCITEFLSDPSETDRYLWTLVYLASSEDGGDEGSGVEQIKLFLDNLIFASADTQKKVITLLKGKLRGDLDDYLSSVDTRMLQNYLDSFSTSATAQNEGLFLILSREASRRKGSKRRKLHRKTFWESDFLFSSRASIKRREEALTRLKQVEIPAAADAIGEAASHGDLSENAEYKAAMEKRDLLLDRLRRWSEELQLYRPYPVNEINGSTVSPGTRVTLQESGGAEDVRMLEIVGPLDADPDRDLINYMAPLGKTLLGKSVGDVIVLPGRDEREWRIASIEVIDLVGE